MKTTSRLFFALVICIFAAVPAFAQLLPSSGLRLHLKADAGTSTTVNNERVSSWADQSGNANGATQGNSGNRPEYIQNAIGGRPALRFNGSSFMTLPSSSTIGIAGSDYEMFFVSKTSSGNVQFLISGAVGVYEIHLNGASGQRFMPKTGQFIDVSINSAFSENVAHIHSARVSDEVGVSRVDGWDVTSNASGRATENLNLVLGGRADDSYYFDGDIAEVIIYSRVLSTSERASVEKYLRDKYSLLPFLPRAGLKAHYKAGSGTNTVANGAEVNIWNDVSANGNTATMNTPDYKPVFASSFANGQPGLAFDPSGGTPAHLNMPTPATLGILNNDYEIFIAGKSSSSEIQFLWSGDVENYELHLNGVSGLRHIPVSPYTTASTDFGSNGAFTDGAPRIFSGRVSATQVASRVNGMESVVNVNGRSSANGITRLGLRADGGYPFDGQMAEVLLFKRNLDIEERRSVERYLAEKYAITEPALQQPVTGITAIEVNASNHVTINGYLNPKGVNTTYFLAYGTSPEALNTYTTSVNGGSGTTTQAISQTLTNLTPGQTYYARLIASTSFASDSSDVFSFTLDYPALSSFAVTPNANLTATFSGTANANGFASSAVFHYGTSRSNLNSSTDTVALAGTLNAVQVTRSSTALSVGETYYGVMEVFNGSRSVRSDTLEFNVSFSTGTVTAAIPKQNLTVDLAGTASGNGLEATARFIVTWNNGFSRDSSQAFLIGANDVDRPISAQLPLPAYNVDYQVFLRVTNSIRPYASPAVSVDSKFALFENASLAVDAADSGSGIRFNAMMRHFTAQSEYRLFFWKKGQPVDSTGFTGSTQHGASVFAEPVENVFGSGAFNQDDTVYVVPQGRVLGGKTSLGDTLSVVYKQPVAGISETASFPGQFSVAISGAVIPWGFETRYKWVWGTNRNALNDSTAFASAGSGVFEVPVDYTITGLSNATTYYVALLAKSGNRVTSSDTLTVNVAFPDGSISSAIPRQNGTALISGSVNPRGKTAEARIVYRRMGGDADSTNSFQISAATNPVPFSGAIPLVETLDDYEVWLVVTSAETRFTSLVSTFNPVFHPLSNLNAQVEGNTSGAGVKVTGTLQHKGQPSELRIRYGTSRSNLNQTSSIFTATQYEQTTNEIFELIFGTGTLVPGTTYYFAASSNPTPGGNVWTSDTLSIRYVQTSVAMSQTVSTTQLLTAALSGSVRPQGFATSYKWVYGTTRNALNDSTAAVSINGTFDTTAVSGSLSGLQRFQTYFAALQARAGGAVLSSDTVSFNTNYAALTINTPVSNPNGTGLLTGNVQTGGLETSAIFVYGTNRTNLDTPVSLGVVDGDVSASPSSFSLGQKYYVSMLATNSFNASRSDTLEIDFRYATNITMNTMAFDSTSAGLYAMFRTHNQPVNVRFAYGTDAGTLSDTTAAILIPGSSNFWSEVRDTLTGLSPNTLYYVKMLTDTYGNKNASTVESVSTRLPRALSVSGFQATGGDQGNLNFSFDPNGNATYFNILWGSNPNDLTNFADTTGYNYPAGTSRISVSYPLTDLPEGTVYVRVTVYEKVNFGNSTPVNFSFQVVYPRPVLTIASPVVNGNAVTFKGTINPNGYETAYSYFTGVPGQWNVEILGGENHPTLNGSTVQNADISTDSLGNGTYFTVMKAVTQFATVYSDTLFFSVYKPGFANITAQYNNGSVLLQADLATYTSDPTRSFFMYGTTSAALNDTTVNLLTSDYSWDDEPATLNGIVNGFGHGQKIYFRPVSKLGDVTFNGPVDSFAVRHPSDLTLTARTVLSSSSLQVSASYEPNGFSAGFFLEFGASGNALQSTDVIQIEDSTGIVTRDFTFSGLNIGTTYRWRVGVTSSALQTTWYSNFDSLFFNPVAPTVVFKGTTIDEGGNVYAHAVINPNGFATTWGLDVRIGTTTEFVQSEDTLRGTEPLERSLFLQNPLTELQKSRFVDETAELGPEIYLGTIVTTNLIGATQSEQLPFSFYGTIVFVTSLADDATGFGQQGTLRYVIQEKNRLLDNYSRLIGGVPSTRKQIRAKQHSLPDKLVAKYGLKNRMKKNAEPDITEHNDIWFLIYAYAKGTISLQSELPPINYNVGIIGRHSDSLIISGNNLVRPFFVGAPTGFFHPDTMRALGLEPRLPFPTLSLNSLTIVNGRAKGGDGTNGGGGAAGMGGAVFVNSGVLNLNDVRFHNNIAVGGAGSPGSSLHGRGGSFAADGSGGYLGGSITQGDAHGGPGAGGGNAFFDNNDSYAGDGGFGGGGGSRISFNYYPSGNGGFGGGAGAAGYYGPAFSGFGAQPPSITHGGAGAGLGGAIFCRSGGIEISGNVTFMNNTAHRGDNAPGFGNEIFSIADEDYSIAESAIVSINGNPASISDFYLFDLDNSRPTNAGSLTHLTTTSDTTALFVFTAGTGTGRIIVAYDEYTEDASFNPSSTYTKRFAYPSMKFSKNRISTNCSLVYSGSGNSLMLSGLEPGKTYYLDMIEYTDTLANGTAVAYSNDAPVRLTYVHLPGTKSISTSERSTLLFNGNGDYIQLNGPGTNFQITTEMTLEAWIFPLHQDTPTAFSILSNDHGNDRPNRFTFGVTADRALEFRNTFNGVTYTVATAAGAIKVGWNHIAVTADGSIRKLYVNGVLRAEDGSVPSDVVYNNADSLLVGKSGSGSFFFGILDELKIRRRVASQSEIFDYMFRADTLAGGLLGYYQFENLGNGAVKNGITGKESALRFSGNAGFGDSNRPRYGNESYSSGTFASLLNVAANAPFTHESNAYTVIRSGAAYSAAAQHIAVAAYQDVLYATQPVETTSVPGTQLGTNRFLLISADTLPVPYSVRFFAPELFYPLSGNRTDYRLYRRVPDEFGGSNAWILVADSASALMPDGKLSFEGITMRGEFAIGRNIPTVQPYTQSRGTALRLNPELNSAMLTLPSSAVFNNKFTIETWFKVTDSGPSEIQFLTSRQYESMEIHLITNSGSIRFIPVPGVYVDSPNQSFVLDEWAHIACTYDGESNEIHMYVNGKEVSTTISTEPPYGHFSVTGGSIQLGKRGGIYHFYGQMDELRIWNAVRTPAEIWDYVRDAYTGTSDNLIAYLQFNEGVGAVAHDTRTGAAVNLSQGESCYYKYEEELGGDILVCEPAGSESDHWAVSDIPTGEHSVFTAKLTGSQGWRFLASPVQTTIGGLMSNLWTQGFEGASTTNGASNVYTWSNAGTGNAATNWNLPASASQPFPPGAGALVYVYANDNGPSGSVGSFPKTLRVNGQESGSDFNLSARLNPNTGGWALLGNPYPTNISWNQLSRSGTSNAVYVWDHNASGWKSWNGTVGSLNNGEIGAFNGFFVYTMAESPTLNIPKSARSFGDSPFLGKTAAAPASFALKLNGNGLENKAWMVFDENSSPGFDANDAVKLTPYSGNYILVASVLNNQTLLDIDSRPFTEASLEVPVAVKTTNAGTFTLALSDLKLPDGWQVKLIDHQESRTVDLKSPYTFTMQRAVKARNGEEAPGVPEIAQADNSPRFTLVISKVVTAIADESGLPRAFALSQNYPNPFNPSTTIKFELPEAADVHMEVFDLTGRKVATLVQERRNAGYHQVNFNASRLASGMYILRMQTAGKTFVKKMTLLK